MSRPTKTRRFGAGVALAMALVWIAWYGWLVPAASLSWLMAAIGALPLLLLAPGLLRESAVAGLSGGLLALFYLAHGVMELLANPEARILASLSSLGALALFFLSVHALRVERVQRG